MLSWHEISTICLHTVQAERSRCPATWILLVERDDAPLTVCVLKIHHYLDNGQLCLTVVILCVFWPTQPIETRSEIFNQDSFDLVLQLNVHSTLIEIFYIMVTCGKKMSVKYTLYFHEHTFKIGDSVKRISHIVKFMTDAYLLWKKLFDDIAMWFSGCVNVDICSKKCTIFNNGSNTYTKSYMETQVSNLLLFFGNIQSCLVELVYSRSVCCPNMGANSPATCCCSITCGFTDVQM